MKRILLSNDDGVYAPGLEALAKCFDGIAQIEIFAPDRDRSGASNSLSLSEPLRVERINAHTVSVQGTPTDCVHLALTGLLDDKPDMVVSGINRGANLGDDVWYSGTVAAAMEGRFLGLPALAVSLVADFSGPFHYETAAAVVQEVYQRILNDPLPPGSILNVNVPNLPLDHLQGYEVTRLGTRHPAQPLIRRDDPRGKEVYWIGLAGEEHDSGLGTDFDAVRRGYVSLTPLRVDLTDYEAFGTVSSWAEGLRQGVRV